MLFWRVLLLLCCCLFVAGAAEAAPKSPDAEISEEEEEESSLLDEMEAMIDVLDWLVDDGPEKLRDDVIDLLDTVSELELISPPEACKTLGFALMRNRSEPYRVQMEELECWLQWHNPEEGEESPRAVWERNKQILDAIRNWEPTLPEGDAGGVAKMRSSSSPLTRSRSSRSTRSTPAATRISLPTG